MSSKPTLKQIAFLEYMGVAEVEARMTKEQISEILNECFSDWWFARYGDGPEVSEWFHERSQKWLIDRLILHPQLYAQERRDFLLNYEEELGAFVRRKFKGNSSRITRQKLLAAMESLMNKNPMWWDVSPSERKESFFLEFQSIFPKSCDGTTVQKKPRKQTNNTTLSTDSFSSGSESLHINVSNIDFGVMRSFESKLNRADFEFDRYPPPQMPCAKLAVDLNSAESGQHKLKKPTAGKHSSGCAQRLLIVLIATILSAYTWF